MFMQIELSKDWKKVTPISKGWSSDKKYLVETADGKLQLLRISDIDAYEAKKKEYEIVKLKSLLSKYREQLLNAAPVSKKLRKYASTISLNQKSPPLNA